MKMAHRISVITNIKSYSYLSASAYQTFLPTTSYHVAAIKLKLFISEDLNIVFEIRTRICNLSNDIINIKYGIFAKRFMITCLL